MHADLPLLVGWRLDGKSALVVGGGATGAGRAQKLLDAGARVTVVDPRATPALDRLRREHRISVLRRGWCSADLRGIDLVVIAVDDPALSARVSRLARRRRVPVHATDRPALSDFVFPAVHRDGPLQVGVSTGGTGPALAARLRDRIASSLPPAAGSAVRRFGALRRAVRAVDPGPESSPQRMAWLAAAARSLPWERLATLGDLEVRALADDYRRREAPAEIGRCPAPRRRLRIVGAGPGDVGLLTVAARDALRTADLVLADRLVSPAILGLVAGELRIARKLPGRAELAQRELDDWAIESARAGREVVRLKAGDPSLFGRLGEELATLRTAGIDVEVVPGVSSAVAAAAAIQSSLTLRGVADRVLVWTGCGAGGAAVEVPAFSANTSYVLLMAMRRLAELVEQLLEAGFPADLPAAVVSAVGWPTERALATTLRELPPAVRAHGLSSPAVVVLGETVRHSPWFSIRTARREVGS